MVFHQGTILSDDFVMRNPQKRDELSAVFHDAMCFEMEAAGAMEDARCLVIRGISDYADTHKSHLWQPYAAGTAAAFAREILHKIQPLQFPTSPTASTATSLPSQVSQPSSQSSGHQYGRDEAHGKLFIEDGRMTANSMYTLSNPSSVQGNQPVTTDRRTLASSDGAEEFNQQSTCEWPLSRSLTSS